MKGDKQMEGNTEVGKSLSGKKIVVNAIDNNEDEVIQLDKEGATLVFDTSPGRFLELKKVELLSKWNRDRYLVCKDVVEAQKQSDPVSEVIGGIEFGAIRGSAMNRLEIRNADPRFRYWWEMPERVYSKVAQGWQVVNGTREKTIHSVDGRVHRIGKKGSEELILLRIEKEKAAVLAKERVEKDKKLRLNVEKSAEEGMLKVGSKLVTDATSRGVKFEDIE